MAQIKRKKVSKKAVQGQNKNKPNLLKNKLFITISSIVLLLLIAGGIIAGVLVYYYNNQEEEKIDYFSKEYEVNGEKVTFENNTYEGVLFRTNKDTTSADSYYQSHIFFFAYDSTAFYPDEAIDEGKASDADDLKYSEEYKDTLENLVEIQNLIDKYNAKCTKDSDKAYLYIIDTTVIDNNKVFRNEVFGPTNENAVYAFGYIDGANGFQETFKYNGKSQSIYTTSLTTFNTTTHNSVRLFIEQNLVLE